MFVQISTDNHIVSDAEANARLEEKVRSKLKRFESRLSDVEVHVSDVNGSKGGDGDKRVSLEARVNGHSPGRRPRRGRPGGDRGRPRRRQGGARARPCDRQGEGPLRLRSCMPAAPKAAPMIRVASYNMRKAIGTDRKRRPERTIDVLNELDADVIALQEADRRFGSKASAIPLALLDAHSDYKAVELDIRAGVDRLARQRFAGAQADRGARASSLSSALA